MTTYKTIRVEPDESDARVVKLTLDRPERFNAWNARMASEIFGAMHVLDEDEGVRAIVVTGEGRHFCAGADLETGAETFAGAGGFERAADAEARVYPWMMRTPVIAAINGAAVGIGATLPLHWDIRLASTRAKIGFVFTRRGLTPEANSTWLLPRIVGLSKAMDLMITGRIVRADEALSLGLVSQVLEPEALLPRALEMARDVAANTSPSAVSVTRRLLWRQLLESDPVAAKAREDAVFFHMGKQPDAGEGVMSFLEKRPPAWNGKKDDDANGLL